jgi:hypothetical protein
MKTLIASLLLLLPALASAQETEVQLFGDLYNQSFVLIGSFDVVFKYDRSTGVASDWALPADCGTPALALTGTLLHITGSCPGIVFGGSADLNSPDPNWIQGGLTAVDPPVVTAPVAEPGTLGLLTLGLGLMFIWRRSLALP